MPLGEMFTAPFGDINKCAQEYEIWCEDLSNHGRVFSELFGGTRNDRHDDIARFR